MVERVSRLHEDTVARRDRCVASSFSQRCHNELQQRPAFADSLSLPTRPPTTLAHHAISSACTHSRTFRITTESSTTCPKSLLAQRMNSSHRPSSQHSTSPSLSANCPRPSLSPTPSSPTCILPLTSSHSIAFRYSAPTICWRFGCSICTRSPLRGGCARPRGRGSRRNMRMRPRGWSRGCWREWRRGGEG